MPGSHTISPIFDRAARAHIISFKSRGTVPSIPIKVTPQSQNNGMMASKSPPTPRPAGDANEIHQKNWKPRSCNECRRRRCKCSGGNPKPCEACRNNQRECSWAQEEDGRRPINKGNYEAMKFHRDTLEDRVKHLEALLQAHRIPLPGEGQSTQPYPEDPPPVDRKRPRIEVKSPRPHHQPSGGEEGGTDECTEAFGKLVLADGVGVFYGDISSFSHLPPIHKTRPPDSALWPTHHIQSSSLEAPLYRLFFNDRDPDISIDPCKHHFHLPPTVPLTRATHDTVLDLFFKFNSPWCMRVIPDYLRRDMYIELSAPQRPSSGFGIPRPLTQHYSPMLHNAILSLALLYSDDELLRQESTRKLFVDFAMRHLETEVCQPKLATVQALAIISSFYSGLGQQQMGFMYFGQSIRMCRTLGLNVNCSDWVASGHITKETMEERDLVYWSCFNQDKCWATYVGREGSLAFNPRIPLPEVNPAMDQKPCFWPAKPDTNTPARTEPCLVSTTYVESCKLFKILGTQIFDVLFSNTREAGRSEAEVIAKIEIDLIDWHDNLPASLRLGRKLSETLANPKVLMVHLGFWWVTILLHRPLFRSQSSAASFVFATSPPVKRCENAISKIIDLLLVWKRLYGLRFCPVTLIQIAFTAGGSALDLASRCAYKEKASLQAVENARACIGFMREMGISWESANQNAEILGSLLSKHLKRQADTGRVNKVAGRGEGDRRSAGKLSRENSITSQDAPVSPPRDSGLDPRASHAMNLTPSTTAPRRGLSPPDWNAYTQPFPHAPATGWPSNQDFFEMTNSPLALQTLLSYVGDPPLPRLTAGSQESIAQSAAQLEDAFNHSVGFPHSMQGFFTSDSMNSSWQDNIAGGRSSSSPGQETPYAHQNLVVQSIHDSAGPSTNARPSGWAPIPTAPQGRAWYG